MARDAAVRKPVRIAKSRYAGEVSALISGVNSLVRMLVHRYAPDEVRTSRICKVNKVKEGLDMH